MTEETKKVALGGLASLVQDEPYTSVFSDQTFLDAAAVMAMRLQIEQLVPHENGHSPNWGISQIIALLDVFVGLIEETMNVPVLNKRGEIDFYVNHPTIDILNEFILTLNDLRKGIVDEKLKSEKSYSGNSRTSLEIRRIKFCLSIFETFLLGKSTTVKEARERASTFLTKRKYKVGSKEITPNRLKEWGKTYKRDGTKKGGK